MTTECQITVHKMRRSTTMSLTKKKCRITFPKALCVFVACVGLSATSKGHALGFGCAGVAGQVIFMDTLYGAGTGLLITGVLELTRDNNDDFAQRMALGTAIGSGAGLGLGIAEVTLRDCSESSRVKQVRKGLTAPYLAIRDLQSSSATTLSHNRRNTVSTQETRWPAQGVEIGITHHF